MKIKIKVRSEKRDEGKRRLKCENTKQERWNLLKRILSLILSLEERGLERVRGGEKVIIRMLSFGVDKEVQGRRHM